MADTADLIRRAQELAKLAEKATPGPWERVGGAAVRERTDSRLIASVYANAQQNANLIASAPEMARILSQLADELERFRNENVRLKGSTFYECPDCGATCMGKG